MANARFRRGGVAVTTLISPGDADVLLSRGVGQEAKRIRRGATHSPTRLAAANRATLSWLGEGTLAPASLSRFVAGRTVATTANEVNRRAPVLIKKEVPATKPGSTAGFLLDGNTAG